VPVYLIRHAHAGSRSAWQGDDSTRPLSPKGQGQAAAIADALADRPVGHLASSPAARCIETLAPLVAQLEIDVHVLPELGEGADVALVHALLIDLAPRNPALCGHGDLIPDLIDRLRDEGMVTDLAPGEPAMSQKGSMWIIDLEDGHPVTGTYLPPV
jgi:phosphohistidine phosphatase SixA